ncbi:site-specific DNA-methyltransferase [Acinetobacter courvalinii]|uniref:site-specific DNA-methyltransferase (adenine-specific) n=1 Tax=Acinetobacter courvalinii TaxID=280147 RepID=A0AA42L9F5_9GAMM|nr:site-specific DNA-methyltransferase [Acinetobacter courvalinii]MDH0563079.1 site-specific DNA-methyltransferase [Acinetobacter courvalinii]
MPEFEGKVNCIYIDPPYNTGNEGWVYNDNVNDPRIKKWLGEIVGKDGEDLSRHDKWLCMIYPRLKLLHRLLADDGVIFISIDDNEQANLKLICDEIFGYENSIGPIIQNKLNSKNDTLNIQKNHEFILIYSKCSHTSSTHFLSKNTVDIKKVFEENGEYFFLNDPITTRGEGGTLNSRPNLGYTVYYNPETKDKIAVSDYNISLAKVSNDETKIYSSNQDLILKGYHIIRPPKVRNKLGAWTWDIEKFNKEKRNIIIWGKSGSYSVRKRTFVKSENVYNKEGQNFLKYSKNSNSKSILDFSTNEGTKLLNDIMGKTENFDNPKNMEMIKYVLDLIQNKNALILDSFAGSGTTAHAVLKLNAEDGGNRRFILCEMMDYAENITAERVRRVMQGYGEGNKKVEALGGSFDFYELGDALFSESGLLNESVGIERIRQYMAYSESISLENRLTIENPISPSALGINQQTLWLFHYNKDAMTSLDLEFLGTLNLQNVSRPSQFVVYADKCLLDDKFMQKHGITFKRIPRDIMRF